MRKILNQKVLDTETAELVCKLSCTAYPDDFGWHDTGVYLTKKGAWFLAGEGNALSMWSKQIAGGANIGGEGIRLLEESEVIRILENEDEDWLIEKHFATEEG